MTTVKNDNLAKEWPEARQYRRSIRLEFSLYISAIVLILIFVYPLIRFIINLLR